MKWETPIMTALDKVGPCHCTRPVNYDVPCTLRPEDGYCARGYDI